MKIPMRIQTQRNGLRSDNIWHDHTGGHHETVIIGSTFQLERWWAHTQRCIKRFGWGDPLEEGRTITMYNVEHAGVLECSEVQEILARFDR